MRIFGGFKSRKAQIIYRRKWRRNNLGKARAYGRKHYHKYRKKYLAYAINHKDDKNESRRIWRMNNKKRNWEQGLKDKYGITASKFFSMLKAQKGRCAICRRKETFVDKKTGKIRLLSVDHNHKTNEIRKLLCHRCNLGLGIFKDDWKLLQIASNYLRTNKRLVKNG